MTKQKYCFLGDSITEWVYVQSGKRHFNVIRNCADIWSAQLIDLYRESGLFPLNDVNAQTFFCNGKTDRLQSNAQVHNRIAQTILARLFRL